MGQEALPTHLLGLVPEVSFLYFARLEQPNLFFVEACGGGIRTRAQRVKSHIPVSTPQASPTGKRAQAFSVSSSLET